MALQGSSPHPISIAAPPGDALTVPPIQQEQDNWCWAACTLMVLSFYGNTANRQCQLAAQLTGLPDCCLDPASCDVACEVSDVAPLYHLLNVVTTPMDGIAPFATLQTEFAAERPVEVATLDDGLGHTLVGRWAGLISGVEEVLFNDPWDGGVYLLQYTTLKATGIASWIGIS
jgi:hypothetical protein